MTKFLSRQQRNELLEEHRLEHNKRFADRIKTILLLDRGWSSREVAEALFIDESTVRRYWKVYEVGGLEELIEDGYTGGTTKLALYQEKELATHLQDYIYLATKDIISYVHSEYGVKFSESGMRDLLHRLGFTYKKPKVVPR